MELERRCVRCGELAAVAAQAAEPICSERGLVAGHSYRDVPKFGTTVTRHGPVLPGMRGWIVGFDPDLNLPLMEWADETGPEAMHTDEYEVIS